MADVFSFVATKVEWLTDSENQCWTVGFAEGSSEPGEYLILQRAFVPNTVDKSLGIDGYYYSICGQQNSGYGGFKKVLLSETALTIELSDDLTKRYCVQHIIIKFSLEATENVKLSEFLSKIFANSDCVLTSSFSHDESVPR